jgi:NTP pyrophosphatase (non-canonical NTP hydrolase)
MNFIRYQQVAITTAVYPDKGTIHGVTYAALGLAGEAGEVANKIKKIRRDNNDVIDDVVREKVMKEMGGVLWYLAALAQEMGLSLDTIAFLNLEELRSRKERGTLHGDGDNR